jgi:hypothetical protein
MSKSWSKNFCRRHSMRVKSEKVLGQFVSVSSHTSNHPEGPLGFSFEAGFLVFVDLFRNQFGRHLHEGGRVRPQNVTCVILAAVERAGRPHNDPPLGRTTPVFGTSGWGLGTRLAGTTSIVATPNSRANVGSKSGEQAAAAGAAKD